MSTEYLGGGTTIRISDGGTVWDSRDDADPNGIPQARRFEKTKAGPVRILVRDGKPVEEPKKENKPAPAPGQSQPNPKPKKPKEPSADVAYATYVAECHFAKRAAAKSKLFGDEIAKIGFQKWLRAKPERFHAYNIATERLGSAQKPKEDSFLGSLAAAQVSGKLTDMNPQAPKTLRRQVDMSGGNLKWIASSPERKRAFDRLVSRAKSRT